MRLFFLRHGIAEDRQPGRSDFDRDLTVEGVEEMLRVAEGIRRLDLKLDAILSSPLVRARETAKRVARELHLPVTEERRIASGHAFADLQQALAGFSEDARLLLVGHEPDLSTDVATLIGGGRVRMKKAALACVDTRQLAPGAGELRWLLEPDHLAALG